MKYSNVLLTTPGGKLSVGDMPRVVGTLSSTPPFLKAADYRRGCDIVELRVDRIGTGNRIENGQLIEKEGIPVIVTVRLKKEGGQWKGADSERQGLFETALENFSCVDVELNSELAETVTELAKAQKKACIVSFHDFDETPSLNELEAIVRRTEKLGSIVKVSTMAKTEKDVETLKELLARNSTQMPLCVIAMGSLGTETRISFAKLGSCLTYGYLDTPAAPGQLSAEELVVGLRG